MADEHNPADDVFVATVMRHIRAAFGDKNPTCPLCGSEGSDVAPMIYGPTLSREGTVRPASGSGEPLLPLICTRCSHVVLFQARRIGLLPAPAA